MENLGSNYYLSESDDSEDSGDDDDSDEDEDEDEDEKAERAKPKAQKRTPAEREKARLERRQEALEEKKTAFSAEIDEAVDNASSRMREAFQNAGEDNAAVDPENDSVTHLSLGFGFGRSGRGGFGGGFF